ncbi:MAG: ATP-dependent Clp protease adaptor ClpS [Bradymonadales bacterium]|nr:ATP-dependent Clp protease adaptor ClpS [Bradymonadales bacterium]
MAGLSEIDSHICEDVDVVDIEIPKFNVVLYNDDYTSFDFVINLLVDIFHHTVSDAERITMSIHHKGKGVAGTYSKEIAEMKVQRVHQLARGAGFPLRAGIEPGTKKSST